MNPCTISLNWFHVNVIIIVSLCQNEFLFFQPFLLVALSILINHLHFIHRIVYLLKWSLLLFCLLMLKNYCKSKMKHSTCASIYILWMDLKSDVGFPITPTHFFNFYKVYIFYRWIITFVHCTHYIGFGH